MKREFVVSGYVLRNLSVLLLYHEKLHKWLPPGGHVNEGETPDEALVREFHEETGIQVEIKSPRNGVHDNLVREIPLPYHLQLEEIDGKHEHIDLIFVCRQVDSSEMPLGSEECRWFTIEEMKKNAQVPDNVRMLSTLILNGGAR